MRQVLSYKDICACRRQPKISIQEAPKRQCSVLFAARALQHQRVLEPRRDSSSLLSRLIGAPALHVDFVGEWPEGDATQPRPSSMLQSHFLRSKHAGDFHFVQWRVRVIVDLFEASLVASPRLDIDTLAVHIVEHSLSTTEGFQPENKSRFPISIHSAYGRTDIVSMKRRKGARQL
jgi:hypothetical protein